MKLIHSILSILLLGATASGAVKDVILKQRNTATTFGDITLSGADHPNEAIGFGPTGILGTIGVPQIADPDLTIYAGITPSANVQTLLGSASFAAFKTSLSLNNVENTALSTWAGTTNITTVGAATATSLTSATIIGGTGTTSDLTLKTTTGVGATGADFHLLVGNNGATEALTVLNNANLGIGISAPTSKLHVDGESHFTGRMSIGEDGPAPNIGLRLPIEFTGSTNTFSAGFDLDPIITMGAGQTSYGAYLNVTGRGLTTQDGDSIDHVASTRISEPQITVGAGATIGSAFTLYLTGQPTEGTQNWCLGVIGDSYFSGLVRLGIYDSVSRPTVKMHIADASLPLGGAFDSYANLFVSSTDAQAINKGGSLALGGLVSDTPYAFAKLHGKKENATSGNLRGFFSVEVADNTAFVERFRIASTGYVGVGTATPGTTLEVAPAATANGIRLTPAGGGFASIGWGGNDSTAATPVIYSDTNFLAIESKTTNPLYLNLASSGNVMAGAGGGNFIIGSTDDTTGRLQVTATTTQLAVYHSAGNSATLTVGATGIGTFDASGDGHAFVFSDPVSVTGTIVGSSTLTTALGVAWDFGAADATTITSPDKNLAVSVGGTTYYIVAKLTKD